MYATYFGLTDEPFAITPDPHYLFMSERHREALAHLFYGLGNRGGFVQLTGEIGAGKTTICRSLLATLPRNVDVALILSPTLGVRELLLTICDELRIAYAADGPSIKELVDCLNGYLLAANAQGRKTVLIIDEAQNLSAEVLEQIRLLTNLETERHKLLQIFLIGQPELRENLQQHGLRQLAQRVTARYHLGPLTQTETLQYVRHRLSIAGCEQELFTLGALRKIFKISKGVPRTINILCDRALLGAYVTGQDMVDTRIVRNAAREVAGDPLDNHDLPVPGWARVAAVIMLSVAGTLALANWWASYLPENIAQTPEIIQQSAEEFTDSPVLASPPLTPIVFHEPIDEGPLDPALANVKVAAAQTSVIPPQAHGQTSSEIAAAESAIALADLLSHQPELRSSAEQQLLQRWQLPTAVNGDLCTHALAYGLKCFAGRGHWRDLRQLDRPTIISLYSDIYEGPRWAVLAELADDAATLEFSGHQQRFSFSEIDEYWRGEYLVLWRPPLPDIELISSASPRAAIGWLREALSEVQDTPVLNPSGEEFDWSLTKAVMAFQRRSGLAVDGTVGAATFIALNTARRQPGIPQIAALN